MMNEELLTTVITATRILDYIGERKRVLPMTMIKDLDMTKGTLYRFLETLKECNMIECDAQGYYILTFKLFEIGNSVLFQDDLIDIARPSMLRLSEMTGCTVTLGILFEHQVLLIDKVESDDDILIGPPLGTLYPLESTSLGKVLLSSYTLQERWDYYSKVTSDPLTTLDRDALELDLDFLRNNAFIITKDGYSSDIISSASPITKNGTIVAGMGLITPHRQNGHNPLEEATPSLIRTVREISDSLSDQYQSES